MKRGPSREATHPSEERPFTNRAHTCPTSERSQPAVRQVRGRKRADLGRVTDRGAVEVISRVANTLVQISPQHSLRVAIDGITAVGKMTFADKLAEDVRPRGRPCVRGSMEDFRQPSAVRFSRGTDSVEGYYENAYDYGALRSELLHPLGPTGNGSYRCAVYDLATDQRIDAPTQSSVPGLIVIVDGSFLH